MVECGGATRADTVLGGLKALLERGAQPGDWVLVHDAARCLVTSEQIDALIDQCAGDSVGGLLAHKLADTLKTSIDGPGGVRVASTVDRSDKWLAQTPQMFRIGPLMEAIDKVGSNVTDEASAMEAMGFHPGWCQAGHRISRSPIRTTSRWRLPCWPSGRTAPRWSVLGASGGR